MATERAFPATPLIFGGGRILPSPSSYYLTGEDRLRVVSACSVGGVNLKIQWRLVNANGEIIANSVDHAPNSDRSTQTQDYELGGGELLNVTVFAGSGSPSIGQCFVMVQLVRGIGAAAIVLGTLLAGYVTSVQALGFPGSPIQSSLDGPGCVRFIIGTDPAASTEISETVPPGARWELEQITAILVCSAAGGARLPQIFYLLGGAAFGAFVGQYASNPSETSIYTWGKGMNNTGFAVIERSNAALPTDSTLGAGMKIATSTIALAVGDNWSAPQYTVREWLEVNA